MDINSASVFEVLQAKGVTEIYHANSVLTSCQFLRQGMLLSRGTLEALNLTQTPQTSDKLDKRHSIWFDVFTDSVDIHERASRRNIYRPVLFVIDSTLIKDAYTGAVSVTKLNPIKWDDTSPEERWFSSRAELESKFVKGAFDQHIVFRHCGGILRIEKYLECVLLDDPGITRKPDIDYYSMAYGALRSAMQEGGFKVE